MTGPRLMAAPNGARRGKADHPDLPLSPGEIAASAAQCQAAGAEALHLHVRDAEGRHSLDAGLYREAMAAVGEAAPGLAIQITTEAAGRYAPADQRACLAALRPSWASVALREVAEDPEEAQALYAEAAEAGTRLQHILHRPEDLTLLRHWQAQGWISEPQPDVIGVLGQYTPPRAAEVTEADRFLSLRDAAGLSWCFCAFGTTEPQALAHAARRCDWLRVGFENNIHAQDGSLLPDMAASIRALRGALAQEEE